MLSENCKNTPGLEESSGTGRALSRKGKVAQNIVIEVKRAGMPFSFAETPTEETIERLPHLRQILNCADGKRDLFEIVDLYGRETGRALGDDELSRLMGYLRLLEKHAYVRIRYKVRLAKEDIKKGLRSLGIGKADKIMLHSSLSGLGYVEGGAETVCRAFMEVLTEHGVLTMPSFNHYTPFEEGAPGYYSPDETPTANGAIPNAFWRMEGVFRSLNPSHAFAVWGKEAKEYVKDHHKLLTMGEGSPLHLLEMEGGRIVFIDCLRSNTYHHVVEVTNDAPCLGKRTEEYPVKFAGGKMVRCRTWGWRNGSCPVSERGVYFEPLEKRGGIARGKIGNAEVSVMKMGECRKVIEELLRGKVQNVPGCKGCGIRPREIAATVPSDWDDENKKVRPDTFAFVGDIDCALRPG